MSTVQSSFQNEQPKLYICSTPIGNLQDVTFRLLDVLRTVDMIAAEDTRHTRKLLSKFDIHGQRMISYHQHNAESRRALFCETWADGKSIALLSDAGTPMISDPGQHAVALAMEQGIPVVPIPGASAVLSALVGSGLPSQPFAFIGFLPRESKKVTQELQKFVLFPGTLIFYEAPHRLKKTLSVIQDMFPRRNTVLARELTKRHEEFARGSIEELVMHLEEFEARGEYVILVDNSEWPSEGAGSAELSGGVATTEYTLADAVDEVERLVSTGSTHGAAVREVATNRKLHRRTLYQLTLTKENREELGE
jgi:16S rRNA (cytidine1402-2'-O)-methyltransferase